MKTELVYHVSFRPERTQSWRYLNICKFGITDKEDTRRWDI
nr:hypothetical protein [Adhaeribacter aerolatus]